VYLASIPNPGTTDATPKFLHSDDQALIERWIRAENRPGFAIYECPNPLKPGATRHGKESLRGIIEIFLRFFLVMLRAEPDVNGALALKGLLKFALQKFGLRTLRQEQSNDAA